jgi:cytoskeletal protein CcmA (bactofilin family)
MRFLSRGIFTVSAGLALLVTSALPALAAETSNSEYVIVREGDVFPDDLYAGAVAVVIEGTLDGDLIAFAGESVVIDGMVTGSVYAVAPSVTVTGEVQGSLRVATNELEVSGDVGGDLVGVARRAELRPSSEVSGDVLVWAWTLTAEGTIGADLTGSQRHLDVAGSIDGDIGVSVGRLSVVGPLNVGGDFGYRSRHVADGLNDADVTGAVVHQRPLPPNLRVRALDLLGRFLVVLFLTLTALVVAYGWPDRSFRAIEEVSSSPIRKWLKGAVIVFAPVLAVAATALILTFAPAAAAFPLLAVLLPVVLALMGISFALALVAGAPVVGWLGGVLFKRFDMYGSILAGSLMVGVVWFLPVIGWLVPVVVVPLGLGAWLGTWRQRSDEPADVVASRSISTHSGG